MITIDGSFGEGGGQILRTALALSLVTGKAFRIEKIRAGREKPGLRRQHLAAVQAAATVGQAEVEQAALGSQQLVFRPKTVAPGDYSFSVGTAGSVTLVLQTILPALMVASGPSTILLEGGTHNPLAPPFEFVAKTFLPLIHRMGPSVKAKLDRHGFYPAGGGKMRVTIEPAKRLQPVELRERGQLIRITATAKVANLPGQIAERELKVLSRKLPIEDRDLRVEEVAAHGPGNVVSVGIESANVTETFTGFGERGVRAEVVAERVAKEARRYLRADVAVGEHLADQLLLPVALAGGLFKTLPLTAHAETNIAVIRKFLDVDIRTEQVGDEAWLLKRAGPDQNGQNCGIK